MSPVNFKQFQEHNDPFDYGVFTVSFVVSTALGNETELLDIP
jgi:hypothetical protein